METNTPHENEQQTEQTSSEQQNHQEHTSSKKSDSGLEENIAGLLCYLFPICIIFLIIEKKNSFIRFHAFQSLFTAIAVIIISIILSAIPLIGWIILPFFSMASFVLMLYLIYKAYNKERYKLPFIGDLAEKQLNNK